VENLTLDKDLIATIVMNIDNRATTDQKNGNITVPYESESDFKVVEIRIKPVDTNFALNPTILSLPSPLKFGFKIYWKLDLENVQCSKLGCPLLDPRTFEKLPEEPGKLHVNIQAGIYISIRNCWTEMLARSLGHIIILVHFRSKR
jgi:hypothetical protein